MKQCIFIVLFSNESCYLMLRMELKNKKKTELTALWWGGWGGQQYDTSAVHVFLIFFVTPPPAPNPSIPKWEKLFPPPHESSPCSSEAICSWCACVQFIAISFNPLNKWHIWLMGCIKYAVWGFLFVCFFWHFFRTYFANGKFCRCLWVPWFHLKVLWTIFQTAEQIFFGGEKNDKPGEKQQFVPRLLHNKSHQKCKWDEQYVSWGLPFRS